MTGSFRFAHFSDLHFFRARFGMKDFFSKRLIGSANFFLRRRREFEYELLDAALSVLEKEPVSLALISGDLSCTGCEEEFLPAQAFVDRLHGLGIETLVLPGNHDKYTKESEKRKVFYRSFPSSLEEDGMVVRPLAPGLWLIGLDTTLATPLFCAHGTFGIDLEKKLGETMAKLPPDAHVILANHFPVSVKQSGALRRREHLLSFFRRHPQIKLYLHGHTHVPKIVDERASGLPVIVDAGSAVHKFRGGWNIVECTETMWSIQPFGRVDDQWAPLPKFSFIPKEFV